jgi:hypothetical protein
MIEIKQTSEKQYEVYDQTGTLRGLIVESVGFWVVQLGYNTAKACESYDRAVFLAKEHCECQE